ncbi:MAG: hypothetical protein ACRDRX_18520 [Pseudonocardiaceae bacterium]
MRRVSLANACALASANSLANALDLALDLARDLDDAEFPVGTLARVNDLIRALTDAHELILAGDLDHAEFLAATLADAKDLAHALARATSTPDLHHSLARALARDLVRGLFDHDPAARWARAVVAGRCWSTPGWLSWQLVALAVRLLPVSQQRRYRAEFGVELVELSCRERLWYGLRVLAGAWELRRALLEATCSPDGAIARRTDR